MAEGQGRKSRFSDDFKEQAVELYLLNSKSLSTIAKDLGISVATLTNWVRMKKKKTQKDQAEPQDEMSKLRRENLDLKKHLASVEEEALILKKCIAFFTKK